MNTPKLRFEGFEREWEISRLGNFLNHIGSGVTPRGGSSVYQTEGTLFIRSQNVHFAGLRLKDVAFISDEINTKMKSSQLSDSDVLLNITGASIGRATIVPLDFPKANVNQHVCILRTNEYLSPYFLKFFLESYHGQKNVFKDQAGQTREALNLNQIKSFNIGIPCFEEQKKITQFFSLITQRVNLQQEKIKELEEMKKGMMQKIFSQELRFRDEDGSEFPGWKKKSLKELTNLLKDGTHGTHENVLDGPYLLSAKNIKNGKVHFDSNDRKISNSDYEMIYRNYKLQKNDILLSVVGTIGRVALFKSDEKIIFQRSVAIIRFKDEFNQQFMYHQFNTQKFQNQLLINQVVSAQPGIYLGDLAKLTIEIPTNKEQEKIANFLSILDSKNEMEREKFVNLETLKRGFMQQMFL